jgi:hypothetical protein
MGPEVLKGLVGLVVLWPQRIWVGYVLKGPVGLVVRASAACGGWAGGVRWLGWWRAVAGLVACGGWVGGVRGWSCGGISSVWPVLVPRYRRARRVGWQTLY